MLNFCVKSEKNASDTCTLLSEAYEGEAMKKSSVFEWHEWLKEGCENVKDEERSGCPRSHRTDENVNKGWNFVHSYRHLSISYGCVTKFRQRNS
jgi:hypothetical protein